MHGALEHIPREAEIPPDELFAALAAEHDDVFWFDGGPQGTSRIGAGSAVPLAPGEVLPGLRAALADAPLGLVGWLGYELRSETMGMPASRPPRVPPAAFLRVEREYTVRRPPAPPAPAPTVPLTVSRRDGDPGYLAAIDSAQQAILRGDAYLLCLTTEYRVEEPIDVLATYLALRASSATGRGGIVRVGGVTLLSATPERFLEVADGVVRTRPIKGTRRRDADPREDARLARELRADEKERAENVMIVDLMRNDIGRVCPPGTVRVTELLAVEAHPQVHQLVSTIEGPLAPGLDAIDAIGACFPAGSMTGAPKRRAIELLDELEGADRGAYAGAFGRLGPDGTAELNMTIRTIVVDDDGAGFGAGGGITLLSDPTAELAEVELKARALREALRRPAPVVR